MNKIIISTLTAIAGLLSPFSAASSENNDGKEITMILTGASFAVPENGWFEIACENLGAIGINKAVSGQAIMNTANDMFNGRFYTFEQLEAADVLVIDHVHNQNVANPEWLKDDYNDYTMPINNYSIGYDYVIKRYKDDCYKLKDNPLSKYYGTENGKPAKIILCTHWHDSRTTFNPAIRKLAEKWNLPLVEFDTNIGFSKDKLVDGKQPSLLYAQDTEKIDGVVYGWHPKRGKGQYIQQKMAQIFAAKAAEYLGIDMTFKASMTHKDFAVTDGETPIAKVSFKGATYPLSLKYEFDGKVYETTDIKQNPTLITLPAEAIGKKVSLIDVADSFGNNAEVEGSVTVSRAYSAVNPTFDTYVHENFKKKSYADDPVLSLKTGQAWTRIIYVTFDISNIKADDKLHALRLHFKESNLSGNETLLLEGNAKTYDENLNWETRDQYPFEKIATQQLSHIEAGTFVSWDITDFLKKQKEIGVSVVTFRISVETLGYSLMQFSSMDDEKQELRPAIISVAPGGQQGGIGEIATISGIYPQCFDNELHVVGQTGSISIYSADGSLKYSGYGSSISTSDWNKGIYIAAIGTKTVKLIKK